MRKREKRRRRGGSEMGEERGRGERVINRAVLEREKREKARCSGDEKTRVMMSVRVCEVS